MLYILQFGLLNKLLLRCVLIALISDFHKTGTNKMVAIERGFIPNN